MMTQGAAKALVMAEALKMAEEHIVAVVVQVLELLFWMTQATVPLTVPLTKPAKARNINSPSSKRITTGDK